jgi:hypothetical protein
MVSELLRPVYEAQLFTLPYSKYSICSPSAWTQASARHLIATRREPQIPGMLHTVQKPATIFFFIIHRRQVHQQF